MLIDHAIIFIRAGTGGDGRVSFRREKYAPKGGPDGGDGGRGGDIILIGDAGLDTLFGFVRRPHFRAEHGEKGGQASCTGADGRHCEIRVPLGTLVFDRNTNGMIVDVETNGDRFIAARGGAGGFGNEHFKSATHQAPRECTPGQDGEEKTLRLELKLIADVGLIGLPNAGKSTLLRAVSRATPKVADYPFTTLSPHLGIAELPGERRMTLADIPGLIEGASAGAGLGHDFLRHIERTKAIVHLLEASPVDLSNPVENYQAIRRELAAYSDELVGKPEIVAFSKIDLVPPGEREAVIADLSRRLDASHRPLAMSGVTGEGTRELLEACWDALYKPLPAAWER